VSILEANIDDSSPQMLGYAMERLLSAGALDVTFTPIFMKKNRPGTLVSVVATPEIAEQLSQILFAETTTLGMRVYQAERRVLARQVTPVETSFGTIRIKHTSNGHYAPEYDDCRQRALDHNVPLRDVIAEADRIFQNKIKLNP
jgi:uncharacterized protein (DUF111 family)